MKTLLVVAALAMLAGCSLLNPKTTASVTTDVTMGVACVGEVQAAAPACIAEVPSCVALGKQVGLTPPAK